MADETTVAHRCERDRGSTSLSVVLLTPMMATLLVFAVFAGRLSSTKQEVISASQDAARAASVRQYPAAAVADGRAAAEATLRRRSVSCASLTVAVDAAGLVDRSEVSATVTCVMNNSDLAGLGMPGTRTITSTSTVVVDDYRGGDG